MLPRGDRTAPARWTLSNMDKSQTSKSRSDETKHQPCAHLCWCAELYDIIRSPINVEMSSWFRLYDNIKQLLWISYMELRIFRDNYVSSLPANDQAPYVDRLSAVPMLVLHSPVFIGMHFNGLCNFMDDEPCRMEMLFYFLTKWLEDIWYFPYNMPMFVIYILMLFLLPL